MKHLTRTQAIRQKCLDCCCGSHISVRRCSVEKCSLFHYRMGYSRSRNRRNGINLETQKLPG